jgi:anti-anti-sigma regulatory factor
MSGGARREPPALAFAGDLDFAVAAAVADALAVLPATTAIDLRAVAYLDARVLGEFARFANRCAPQRPAIFGVGPLPRRLFDVCGLDGVFSLHAESYDGPCRTCDLEPAQPDSPSRLAALVGRRAP